MPDVHRYRAIRLGVDVHGVVHCVHQRPRMRSEAVPCDDSLAGSLWIVRYFNMEDGVPTCLRCVGLSLGISWS